MTRLGVLALVLSGVLHVGAFAALEGPRERLAFRPPEPAVLFSVVSAEQPLEARRPEPAEDSSMPKPLPGRIRATPPSAPPEAEAEPAQPSRQDEAADLSGITLTSPQGTGWGSAEGNGSSRIGPVPAIRSGVSSRVPSRARTPSGSLRPRIATAPLVPASRLSSPPHPPNLDSALERNYPENARTRGQSGLAVVRARISAAGVALGLRIESESAPGFGRACLRTVAGSHWKPPLDAGGRPVATEVSYRCRFRVRR